MLAGYRHHTGGIILSMEVNKQETTVNGQADETDKRQRDNSETEMEIEREREQANENKVENRS